MSVSARRPVLARATREKGDDGSFKYQAWRSAQYHGREKEEEEERVGEESVPQLRQDC